MVLDIVRNLPDVTIVSLGGGFKVARMPDEKEADMREIGHHVQSLFEQFLLKQGESFILRSNQVLFLWRMQEICLLQYKILLIQEMMVILSQG